MIGVVSGFLLRLWTYSAPISEPLVFTDVVGAPPIEVMPDLNCPADDIETPITNGELAIGYVYLLKWRSECINSILDESERIEQRQSPL
jgi:hypothetical protein